MQDSGSKLKIAFMSDGGSVLVGAVVLCALMAIGVAGLMGVARNTVSQEVEAFDDTRAFLAAESGLLIGAYWFKHARPGAGQKFDTTFDGISIRVRIENSDEEELIRITSTARGVAPDGRTLFSYDKQLEMMSKYTAASTGEWGYFIDDPSKIPLRRTTVFDGPVHFNGTLHIADGDLPRFRHAVTVNNNEKYENDFYGTSRRRDGFNNNYTAGVRAGTANDRRDGGLDAGFLSKYAVNDNSYTMKLKKPSDGGDNLDWHILPKPANVAGSFLKFGYDGTKGGTLEKVSSVSDLGYACNDCYTFFEQTNTSGANNWKVHYGKTLVYGKDVVIQAGGDVSSAFDLYVRDGKMSGKVTVATISDKAVFIDLINNRTNNGSITYNNYTLPDPSTLPLIGSGSNKALVAEPYAAAKGESNYGIGTEDLLAFYSSNDSIYIKTDMSNTTPYTGSNRCVITAQLLAPKGRIKREYNNTSKISSINIIGAMVAKIWWASPTGTADEDALRVFHDRRALNAPGVVVAGVSNSAAAGHVAISKWKETNGAGLY